MHRSSCQPFIIQMEIGKSQQHQQGSLGRAESENNPAACKASNNKTLLRWPLSKYAYFVNDEEKSAEEATQGKKKWHERVAQHKPPNMWIQITQVYHSSFFMAHGVWCVTNPYVWLAATFLANSTRGYVGRVLPFARCSSKLAILPTKP